jgi:hypothetical protein
MIWKYFLEEFNGITYILDETCFPTLKQNPSLEEFSIPKIYC